MKYFTLLLTLCCISLFSYAQQEYSRASMWEDAIEGFKKEDRKNPPEKGSILFIGSSSFRIWKTLKEDFPHSKVFNRSFGGSHLSDVIYFFDDIVAPYKPCQIIVYEGDNDIAAGKSAEEYLRDVITFTRMVEVYLPGTIVDYVSTKPSPAREKWQNEFKKANHLVREFCEKKPNVRFIDVFQLMVSTNGDIRKDIFRDDMLHMNPKGYDLWQSVIRPYLTDCSKE